MRWALSHCVWPGSGFWIFSAKAANCHHARNYECPPFRYSKLLGGSSIRLRLLKTAEQTDRLIVEIAGKPRACQPYGFVRSTTPHRVRLFGIRDQPRHLPANQVRYLDPNACRRKVSEGTIKVVYPRNRQTVRESIKWLRIKSGRRSPSNESDWKQKSGQATFRSVHQKTLTVVFTPCYLRVVYWLNQCRCAAES